MSGGPAIRAPATHTRMLTLPGPAALSPFRLQRLHARLGGNAAGIRGISARFMHFADIDGDADARTRGVLERLLEYGPRREATVSCCCTADAYGMRASADGSGGNASAVSCTS